MTVPAAAPAVEEDVDLRLRDEEETPTPPPKPRTVAKPAARPTPPPKPAYEPPDDSDLPDLAALAPPPVPREEPVAPAYMGQKPGRSARSGHVEPPAPSPALSYASRSRAAALERPAWIEQWVPMLIIAMFVAPVINMLVGGIYTGIKTGSSPPAGAVGSALVTLAIGIIIVAGILAPLLLLCVWVCGKIMNFRLGPGSYATVLASLNWGTALSPVMLILLIGMVETGLDPRITSCILLLFPVFCLWGMIRTIKDGFVLNWGQTAVTIVLSVIMMVIGMVGFLLILGLILGGFARLIAPMMNATGRPMATGPQTGSSYSYSSGTSGTPRAPTPAELANIQAESNKARARSVKTMYQNRILSAQTREQGNGFMDEARQEFQRVASSSSGAVKITDFDEVLAQMQSKVDELPSGAPPDDLNQDVVAAENWDAQTVDESAKPVSFRQWAFRPGSQARVDLTTTEEGDQGVTWVYPEGNRLTIRAVKANPNQKRPWLLLLTSQKQVATDKNFYAMEKLGSGQATTGKISGVAFTRVVHLTPMQREVVQYAGRFENEWLEITLQMGSNARVQLAMDNAAKSIHLAEKGEASSPFTPENLVSRLADSNQMASQMLKEAGESAEPAIIAGLSDSDPQVRRACAALLAGSKSDRAKQALADLARKGDDPAAAAARDAVRQAHPESFDAVDEALVNLQNAKNTFDRGRAYKTLASAKPDDARLDKVAAALEDVLLNQEIGYFEQKDVAAAVRTWHRPSTAGALLKAIATDNDEHKGNRPAIIRAAGATGDKTAIKPISKWVLLEKDAVKDALIEFGPAAEDEVLNLLRDKQARRTAIDILNKIGTKKSIQPLMAVANGRDNFFDGGPAKDAVTNIRAREDAAKAK